MNKIFRLFTDRKFRFSVMSARGLYNWMPDKKFLETKFKIQMGKKLNLDNPKTFNEKLQWLKLYDRNPLYTTLVDKYAVRQYIKDTIGEEYLIPLVGGPWKTFDEIDFDALPDQFVLKCTHDSGGLVICRDKSKLDKEKARRKIEKCLKTNYYYGNREWPYKNVPPQIIAEKYMTDTLTAELRDYKFFCFDGMVKALFIATERANETEETKFDFFDENFQHLPFTNGHPNAAKLPEKPKRFELMKELAAKLSKGIPHVRVDFYEVDEKVYFGELTFFHWSGLVPFNPPEWDQKVGDWITLQK